MPRLGLTATVVATKISSFLQKELSYGAINEFFWTNSNVVLGYISNEASRFHTFVANECKKYATTPPPVSGLMLTPKRTQLLMPQEVWELTN